VTRDERGYENTFLLHVRGPGDRPHVLYWFRSAPGVRVGRPALDEDAIRAIEEQHPEIEFDWEHLIEASTMLPPEVERRPDRPRRRPRPDVVRIIDRVAVTGIEDEETPGDAEPLRVSTSESTDRSEAVEGARPPARESGPAAARGASRLLEELVGREIATRLRARHADLVARLGEVADPVRRAEWQARAAALDPDSWDTPDAILDGVQHADRRLDQLRADMGS
jgi:hypothetical protein